MNNQHCDRSDRLYDQDTEFNVLSILIPHILTKTFIDVGAEKGMFAKFLINSGFQGVLFEPCPKHHEILDQLTKRTGCQFFPYAIDECDREATLYISCDERGEPQDYFHSLHCLPEDPQVKHQKEISVSCRSLRSLLREGIIGKDNGVLKIDTEGNDLRVLMGLGELRAEVLICEFFTEGLFAGWEQGNPAGLISEAKGLGYNYYIATKRCGDRELVSFSPAVFCKKQWGNLIFLSDAVYNQSFEELEEFVVSSEMKLLRGNIHSGGVERGEGSETDTWWRDFTSLEDWLKFQLGRCTKDARGRLLIDVGAYHGEFARKILPCQGLKKALLFEPNPRNILFLEKCFSGDERFSIEKLALGDQIGDVTFYCDKNLSTGSILRYFPRDPGGENKVGKFAVNQVTLDDYLGKINYHDGVGLIKVDTQGYDLNVLRGAEYTIQKSQPWIVVELIFLPLYENQANPIAIYEWLNERGYRLTGIFNEHHSENKLLAFADAVFAPAEVPAGHGELYHLKPDWISLKTEVDMLRTVCSERLELINALHEEAGKRLEIIQRLEKHIKRKRW